MQMGLLKSGIFSSCMVGRITMIFREGGNKIIVVFESYLPGNFFGRFLSSYNQFHCFFHSGFLKISVQAFTVMLLECFFQLCAAQGNLLSYNRNSKMPADISINYFLCIFNTFNIINCQSHKILHQVNDKLVNEAF